MKLLVLSYWYRPSLAPRAFRWSAICEHWATQGHEVDVVCGPAPAGAPEDERWQPGTPRVLRAGGDLASRLRAARSRESVATARQGVSHGREGAAQARRAVRRVVLQGAERAWRLLYWPDPEFLWYWAALRVVRAQLAAERYDALVSVAVPFTGHLVALRALGPAPRAVRWLADSGDPFSFEDYIAPNNARLYGALNRRAERSVIDAAHVVTAPTEPVVARYRELFPEAAARIHLVPPLMSSTGGTPAAGARAPSDDEGPSVVFAGRLYAGFRSPAFLLRIADRLIRSGAMPGLTLHFYGDPSGVEEVFRPYAALIGTRVLLHGLAPRATAQAALAAGDALVNVTDRTRYAVPSKLLDYAQARRPILNLVYDEADPTVRFLSRHPAVLTVRQHEGDPDDRTVDAVRAFLERSRGLTLDPERFAWLDEHRVEAIAARYEALLRG